MSEQAHGSVEPHWQLGRGLDTEIRSFMQGRAKAPNPDYVALDEAVLGRVVLRKRSVATSLDARGMITQHDGLPIRYR